MITPEELPKATTKARPAEPQVTLDHGTEHS